MQSIKYGSGHEVGPDASLHDLVFVLGGCLIGYYELSEAEVLAVKSWLLNQAERSQPGHVVTLGVLYPEDNFACFDNAWVAVGKSPDGEAILWHRPLPYPPGLAAFMS